MEHVHEKSLESNLFVPWEYVFFFFFSGFEFEDRPGLQELLSAAQSDAAFSHIVIEYLDRLSRNADWHQGYLIERFQKAGQELVWWKPYHSRIERAVFGAISQDGMEQIIERTKAGRRKKAESGRVTATVSAYGYVFVDSQGRGQDDPKSRYRKDTHYAIHPEEARIIRRIYRDLVYESMSLYKIADALNTEGLKPFRKAKAWHPASLSDLVRNPLYKGEFYANRYRFEKRWNPEKRKYTRHQVVRPREEWILVPVPAIVEPELWEAAQEILKINIKNAERNASREWLLTGYLTCANCGYRLTSATTGNPPNRVTAYNCASKMQPRTMRETIGCDAPIVRADQLEPAVWGTITEVICNPALVIQQLEEKYSQESLAEKETQLTHLESQAQEKDSELERWNQAYGAGFLSLAEWGERKQAVQQERAKLNGAIAKVQGQLAEKEDLEQQKEIILTEIASLEENEFGEGKELPFKLKRRIVGLLVDNVVVDTRQRTFELHGVIRATRSYGQQFGSGSSLLSHIR
jgi:site-specific DNA recombinase